MIPLRDSEATHRLTPVNTILILANLAVFVLEVKLGRHVGPMLARYAMVPAHIAHLHLSALRHALATLATFITSTFLHAGIMHIAGNMLYLFIFGPAIEERLGTPRYLYFYFAAAVAAALAMVAMGPESRVPVIGASGAIAGVLGAYFILYPRGRILTILPLFIFVQFIEIPAVIFLFLWFAVQLYAGLAVGPRGASMGGVAWWAHVGGFLFGVAIGPILARPARRKVR